MSTVACRVHKEHLKRLQALYEQTITGLRTTPNVELQTWCDTIQATFPTLFLVAVAEAVADPPPMAIEDRGAAQEPKRRRPAAAPTEQPPNTRPRRAGSGARPGALPKNSAR